MPTKVLMQPPSRSTWQSFLAVNALHSDGSRSLISGRKGKAKRGELPPEPSRAASGKAIPSRRQASMLACHARHRLLGNEKGKAAGIERRVKSDRSERELPRKLPRDAPRFDRSTARGITHRLLLHRTDRMQEEKRAAWNLH